MNTIKDCDKILLLKRGTVAEFDKFDTLVNTEEGELREMARIAISKTNSLLTFSQAFSVIPLLAIFGKHTLVVALVAAGIFL